MSVLRYVQRTGEPLVVADATRDDRFARDPYFTDLDCCSLLAVPILSRGTLRAVLLLENRLLRGAFTTDRLDAVTLIAGQLAVSLDNAQLYAELTTSRARIVAAADHARRRIERDLHDGAQQRLVSLALQLRAAQADATAGGRRAGGAAGRRWPARRPARWTNCARSPAAFTRRSSPTAGCARRWRHSPAAAPSPSAWTSRIDGRLPEPVEIAAYYTVSEALTNTAKHAHASVVRRPGRHRRGDGATCCGSRSATTGAAAPTSARGTGLLGLKDRVEALGGRIHLHSPPGAGTTLRLELPLTDANGATFR